MKNFNKNEKLIQEHLALIENDEIREIIEQLLIFEEDKRPDLDEILNNYCIVSILSEH